MKYSGFSTCSITSDAVIASKRHGLAFAALKLSTVWISYATLLSFIFWAWREATVIFSVDGSIAVILEK